MSRSVHVKADYCRIVLIPQLEGLKGFDGELDRRLQQAIIRARQIVAASEKQTKFTAEDHVERAGIPTRPQRPESEAA